MSSYIGFNELLSYDFFVSTGSLKFDIFLDGGYRPGISVFGAPPEHGKTLQCLAWADKWLTKFGENGEVYYYDTEGRMSVRKLSLSPISKNKHFKTNFFLWSEGNIYEDIAEDIWRLVQETKGTERRLFFVIDSLNMVVCKRDLDKKLAEDEKMATEATLTTRLIKRVGPHMESNGHHLHVLRQIRANMQASHPHSKKTKSDSGGYALQHQSSLTGDVQKIWRGANSNTIYDSSVTKPKASDPYVGHYHEIVFEKTPNEKSGQKVSIPIKRGHGIWLEREIVDICLEWGLIQKKGAWYSMEESIAKDCEAATEIKEAYKWQGLDKVIDFVEGNKSVCDFLEKLIRNRLLPLEK